MRVVVVLPLVPVIAAIGMRERRAAREEHVDHRPGDVARLALGGRDVHAEAGRGVDLDDRAADLAQLREMSGRDEVDAADVEADRLDGPLGDLRLSWWMTSVLSIAVPPVDRLPVERR